MTLDEIRKLAERALQPPRRDGGPNPTPDLARFAIAVLDVLDGMLNTPDIRVHYDIVHDRLIADITERLK